MVRKAFWILLTVTLISSLLLGCASQAPAPTPSPQAKVYEFRYASHLAPGGMVTERAVDWYTRKVEELSKGQIKIKVFHGGQLGGVKENLGLAQSGTVEMTFIPTFFYAGEMPLYTYNELPFLIKSPVQHLRLNRYMNENVPELKAYWEKYNQYPVARSVDEEAQIHTRKPVTKPADMKGLKMRIAGGAQGITMEALGAVAVSIGVGETYQAIQTGVVDGNFVHALLERDFKWYEVAPYTLVTTPGISRTFSYATINLNTWKSLPQNLKDVMLKAAEEHEAYMAESVKTEQKKALDAMTQAGVKVTTLNEAQTQEWREALKGVEAVWLKQYPEGKRVLDMAKDWLQKNPE